MNSRERFMCALRGGQPDRVPLFDFLFSQYLFEEVIGRKDEWYNARDAIECTRKLSLDGVWIPFSGFSGYKPEFLAENVYKDEWGTTYKKDPSISWPIDAPIDYPIKTREDLKSYVAPDPMAEGRLDLLREANELAGGELAILGGVAGPLCTAWLVFRAENVMMSLYDDADLLADILKISNEFYIAAGRRMVDAGLVDAVIVSEDLGDSNGPFCSLEHFRRHFRPYLEELIGSFVQMNIPVLLHSCGNINLLLDDLVGLGISGLHPMQRTAGMDLGQIKRDYGERICLVGNIDSSVTLPYGSEDEVAREVVEAVQTAGPGGGDIVASDHSLHDGIPMANIWKMMETAKEWGRYPLAL